MQQAPVASGSRGRDAHIAGAVRATLDDVNGAVFRAAEIGKPVRLGGLRAGWVRADTRRLTLHAFSYVPGVRLTGTLAIGSAGPTGRLNVRLPGGERLRVQIDARGRIHLRAHAAP